MTLPLYVQEVLKSVPNPTHFLGKGGEGWIFALGRDRIVKIYVHASRSYLESVAAFQKKLSQFSFTFKTPQILEIKQIVGRLVTIEQRLPGKQLDHVLPALSGGERHRVFQNYYDAVKQIHAVQFPSLPYEQILAVPEAVTASSWPKFLRAKLQKQVKKMQNLLQKEVIDLNKKLNHLDTLLESIMWLGKQLVHCDYYMNNVLVNADLTVSAVLDFSIHAVVGDPRLDISSVLTWLVMDKHVIPSDYEFLYPQAEADYGKNINEFVPIYLLYSNFYYADMDDPSWSLKNLNDASLWKQVGLK